MLGFLLVTSELYACSCREERTVKEGIKHSDAVVVGEIISKDLVTLEDLSEHMVLLGDDSIAYVGYPFETVVARYELVMTGKYKGKVTRDTIEIYTGLGGGDCGVNFQKGQHYIIYGREETYFGPKNNNWPYPKGRNIYWTNTCSRTTLENSEEISAIEKYRKRR